MIKSTLRNVLRSAENHDWRLALHLPQDRSSWSLTSKAVLEDPDDVDSDDPEALPDSVGQEGCVYAISMQDLRGVVENLKAQTREPSDEALFSALMYYLRNDAFIVVDGA